ncbi:ExeM/NucH family extracellular endonuclease, partial [Cyanothece sp. BG0011]|uniref:ExeM/NucH family extracellular endonuclease n=1 Tax=Cyanothece sp. BG0011 TaxID=2082950 RepID=UPI0018E587D8
MFIEDFNLFTAAGFAPDGTLGLLNSNAWMITGLSDGSLNFGDTATSGDLARGTSSGGVTTGGVYSFEVANGNNILGVQPAGSDFTPGEIVLRLQNTGEITLTEVTVNYDIFFFNDQSRANALNFSYSLDNVTYTPVAALDFTTPETAETSPIWESVNRSTIIDELSLNPDDFFYLKWTGDDVSGSGSRDEYGIDNINVSGLTLPEIAPLDVTAEFIHTIQGDGFQSPLTGETVTVEAVVIGDFQGNTGLSGFFVQEEDADVDDNPLTSEGIFIFDGSSPSVDVNTGDLVRVTGTVAEFNNLTELTNVSDVQIISSNNALPTAATVNFPVSEEIDLESVEGMLITIPDTLFVTEYFNLDRFGEIRLASNGDSNAPNTDGRLDQYTQFNAPDVDGFSQYQDDIANRQIVLDDGSSVQNPETLIFGRDGNPLSSTNTLRGGDTITGITGVLDERFGDYRLQTNQGVDFQAINERPETPEEVGGTLKVAAFNVLNFFTTLDNGSGLGSGPNNLSPRGADSQEEFDRQIEKLVTTLSTLDADILALTELENEFGGDQNGDGEYAIDTLVNALNDSVGAGTYAYVDPGVNYVGGDAIAVGAIYKTETVQVAPGTTVALLTDDVLPSLNLNLSGEPIFEGNATSRVPLAVTFEEIATGETFTLAVNHFKSKGSSGLSDSSDPNFDQGDGQGFWNFRRTEASQALDAWLKTDPTGSGDSDYLIAGDLNAYAQEDPITFLENQGYTDLVEEFVGDEAYSFLFDGQYGTLDYALANETLQTQVTGATEWRINADEPDALDYNLDFGRDPDLFDGSIPYRTSDHDPIVVSLDLESTTEPFTLQILHSSDQEAGIPALEDAIGLSAVMNALEDDYENTLKLSSGDLFIAGPFFNASRNIYGEPGIADILIQNELGWDAAAIGNHEFDAGPGAFATLISPDAAIQGVGIDGNTGYTGTAFPYLATNLDYSTDSSNLQNFVVPDGEESTPNSLAGSVVIDVGGEAIGVVGAVTPILPQISNIGGITMLTDSTVTSIEDQAQTIAENVQPVIDKLVAQGINKIVLMTHLQQFEIEQALSSKLTDVDVLMGGGNHRVMASEDDILRQDETQTASQILQPYPQVFSDADNNPIYLVNTAANYRYLGQLVVEFDANGIITNIGDESGTFATDIAGVDRLYDQEITTFDQVKTLADPELVEIVDNIGEFINSQDGNIFGNTEVYLNGLRESVRSEETNLGNLTADANLWYARQYGFDVDISVKNGGGIRDQIGVSFIEGGTNELIQLPPQPNPEVGKAEGDISQLDISNSLRFDNKLSVVDISAQGIKDLAEHLVARWTPEATPGQFGQN